MEKQNDNPRTMKNSKKGEKTKFSVSGGGGIIVIGATVVAATIAAAFVAYRDKRCSKQGGDRTIKNGADEKAEKGLKAETKSDMAKEEIIETRTKDGKNYTADDFSFWNNSLNNHKETKDVVKEASSEERTDGVFELEEEEYTSMEQRNGNTSVVTSEKSENENYEQRIGNMQTEREKVGEKKDGDAFAYVGVKVLEQQSKGDFVTNTELVDEEEANKVIDNAKVVNAKENEKGEDTQWELKERDDKVEYEEVQGNITYIEVEGKIVEKEEANKVIDNANVVNAKENEKGEDTQRDLKERDEKDEYEEVQGNITYIEVEGKIVDKEEANNVIDNANVVNAKENEKGEDTQRELKERDEKDEYEEVQGNMTYIEVKGKIVDKEETFGQYEEIRGDDKGNTEVQEYDEDSIILKDIADSKTTTVSIEMEKRVEESRINVEHRENEENTGLYLNLTSEEEQEKERDFALIDVGEENGQNVIDYVQEEGNKVREEEKQDNTNEEVYGITLKGEEQEDIRHDDEERTAMEKENQNQYGDDTEVEIEVAEEKEENEGQKGVDNVYSSEINDEQNGEYITVGEGSYEDMKLVKTVENQEKIDENAYTELSKGNNADDVCNAVHAQQTHKEEEDDVEIGREDDIVGNEIDMKEVVVNKELNEVEEKEGKTGVAKGLHDVVNKEEIKEQNNCVILKEMDNDDKEFVDITKEKDIRVEEKEQDDIKVGVFKLREEEPEDTSHVEEERNVIENEKERNDSNINVEVKLVEGYDIISVENNLNEDENKEDETANAEINEVETEVAKRDMAQEVETKTVNETQHKKTEEKMDEMNKEIPGDGFAAFQENNMEKEDEDSEDETENEMKQQFADQSRTKNDNEKEDTECLMLEKEKKTTYMSMDHISEGLFLLVFAISIAVGILAIFADKNNLPRFLRELFQFFFPSLN